MPIQKITETETSSSASPDTHFLVTQPEANEAGKLVESLRRIKSDDIANMLKAKFGLGDTAKELASLKRAIGKLYYTNNLATLAQIVHGAYWSEGKESASDNYNYFSAIPVFKNKKYYFGFSARFVNVHDANGIYTDYAENVTEYISTINGYMYISFSNTLSENVYKIWTIENEEIIAYGKYLVDKSLKVQALDDSVKKEISSKIENELEDKIKNGETSAIITQTNLIVNEECVNGYLEKNGTLTNYGTYKTTGFIPVKSGFKYKIKETRKFLAFDSLKNVISSSWRDQLLSDYEYIPVNDGYIRFSTSSGIFNINQYPLKNKIIEEGILFSETMKEEVAKQIIEKLNTSSIVKDIESLKSGNILYGKKWWACGDSFTEWSTERYNAGDFPNITAKNGYNYKSYPFYIASRNNMICHNYAVSGQTMAYPTLRDDGSNSNFENAFSNEMYKEIPEDVDYITLWFGINDSHHRPGSGGGDGESNEGIISIGSIDDTATNTFYGAWNTVMNYLIEHHPYAKIGIIATNGAETNAYAEAEVAIAKKWGIGYIDLNADYHIPLMHRVDGKPDVCERAKELRKQAFWADFSAGNGHPNAKAHEYQSTFIEAWMRGL